MKRSFRALIYDETLDLVQRLNKPLGALDGAVAIASSPQELQLALTTFGPHDVLIVNAPPVDAGRRHDQSNTLIISDRRYSKPRKPRNRADRQR